jgi:hypothetical protein
MILNSLCHAEKLFQVKNCSQLVTYSQRGLPAQLLHHANLSYDMNTEISHINYTFAVTGPV